MRVIYIAGPYSADTPEGVARNVQAAANAGRWCMAMGWAVVCPHSMTHGWERDREKPLVVRSGDRVLVRDVGSVALAYQQFIDTDLELLRRCDAVCLVGDWQHSPGARGEVELAEALGLPIWPVVDVPFIWRQDALVGSSEFEGQYACEMCSDPFDNMLHARARELPGVDVTAPTLEELHGRLCDAIRVHLSEVAE